MTKKGLVFGPQNVRKSRRAKMGLPSMQGSQGQFSMNKIMLWPIHVVGSATGGEATRS